MTAQEKENLAGTAAEQPTPASNGDEDFGDLVNTSGHVQELDRSFGIWSVCAVSVMTGNTWGASAGTIVTAIYNGGPPGVIYEFIAACIFYSFIGAALAELASAIPSSASVYHWASVTGGRKYGRVCSWYAGWWNYLAWNFGSAASSIFPANAILAIYSLYHEGYEPTRWHIFLCFLGINWLTCAIVLFGQRILPQLGGLFGFICIVTWFISLLICAVMPSSNGNGYASGSFVWKDWYNQTGYTSNGFVLLLGMLNGASGIGTPDAVTHMAEEMRNPKRDIPWGILAQVVAGFATTVTFYIVLAYAINDLDSVLNSPLPNLPLAAIYLQATNSNAATTGLLLLFFLDCVIATPGTYITSGRMLWTLARDNATPFPTTLSRVSPRFHNPFAATLVVGFINTILGLIYLGSATAFNAFVGCFVIFTTLSYLGAFLPNLLTRRHHVIPGPFWMPEPYGSIVLGVACSYIIVFDVIYLFPYALPTSAETMNYACLLVGGSTIFITAWYRWKRVRGYVGPRVKQEASESVGVVLRGEKVREMEEKIRRRDVHVEEKRGPTL